MRGRVRPSCVSYPVPMDGRKEGIEQPPDGRWKRDWVVRQSLKAGVKFVGACCFGGTVGAKVGASARFSPSLLPFNCLRGVNRRLLTAGREIFISAGNEYAKKHMQTSKQDANVPLYSYYARCTLE